MLELMELTAGGASAVAKGDTVLVDAMGARHAARVCQWVHGHLLVEVIGGRFKAIVYPDAVVEVIARAAA